MIVWCNVSVQVEYVLTIIKGWLTIYKSFCVLFGSVEDFFLVLLLALAKQYSRESTHIFLSTRRGDGVYC